MSATALLIDNNRSNSSSRYNAFVIALINIGDADGKLWSRADGSLDTYDNVDPRHLDGVNLLFVDGHVKWMKKDKALYRPLGANTSCSSAWHLSTDENFLWNRF